MFPGVDRLVRAYCDTVQPRMAGLPMYNGKLEVEAVGFAPRDGCLSGVLITPWFMNLVLLSDGHDDWAALAPGTGVTCAFPSGEQVCTLSAPEGIDPHLSLPLFTTVLGFTDQDTARRVAGEVLQRLYHPSAPESDDPPQPRSRREFLRDLLPLREG